MFAHSLFHEERAFYGNMRTHTNRYWDSAFCVLWFAGVFAFSGNVMYGINVVYLVFLIYLLILPWNCQVYHMNCYADFLTRLPYVSLHNRNISSFHS